MEQTLVYAAYAVAAMGAIALYWALPKEGRQAHRGALLLLLALTSGGVIMLFSRLFGAGAQKLYFDLLGLIALGGAVRVVTHPRPVYSALFFILVVLSTAALLAMVGAEFLAAALVIVYAGAILVTYVFVIMLAQQSSPREGGAFAAAMNYDRNAREPLAAVLACFILVGTIAGVLVSRDWGTMGAAKAAATDGNTLALGRVLLTDFAVSVELAGVLLMVAMIGAIALARRKLPRSLDDEGPEPGEIGKHVAPY